VVGRVPASWRRLPAGRCFLWDVCVAGFWIKWAVCQEAGQLGWVVFWRMHGSRLSSLLSLLHRWDKIGTTNWREKGAKKEWIWVWLIIMKRNNCLLVRNSCNVMLESGNIQINPNPNTKRRLKIICMSYHRKRHRIHMDLHEVASSDLSLKA
jgi:hypothetical protein